MQCILGLSEDTPVLVDCILPFHFPSLKPINLHLENIHKKKILIERREAYKAVLQTTALVTTDGQQL